MDSGIYTIQMPKSFIIHSKCYHPSEQTSFAPLKYKVLEMVLSLEDPAVRSYIVYSSVLALKMLGVGTLTSLTRGKRKAFANPEDAKAFKGKLRLDDPEVERVRRAHLNDLENIPAFWILGALYLTTHPLASWATLLFRLSAAGRILHTIVYAVVPLPQPARALAYIVPYGINIYMGVQVIMHYATSL